VVLLSSSSLLHTASYSLNMDDDEEEEEKSVALGAAAERLTRSDGVIAKVESSGSEARCN